MGDSMDNEGLLVPEWVVTLVGRLQLENEGLRQALRVVNQPAPDAPDVAAFMAEKMAANGDR